MKKLLLTLSILALAARGQSGLGPPRLGFVAGADNALRPVIGIAGNLLAGEAVVQNVTSAAWSGSFGWVKTEASLGAFDGSHMVATIEVAPGPALFAFPADGAPALALLVKSGQLYGWKNGKLAALRAEAFDGQPLAIASLPGARLSAIVQRQDGLWLVEESAQTGLPGIQPPVLLQNDGSLLYVDGTALVIRNQAGVERSLETGVAIGALEWMGSGWVHAVETSGGRHYAIRIVAGRETISQLPEAR